MIRATSVTCLLIAFATMSVAHAGPRQPIAVLGLEVTGNPDLQSTGAAKEITEQLRNRVNVNTTKYVMSGGSNKELIDEKMILCNNEQPSCLSQIAADVNAVVLIYGKLDRKGSDYVITVKLFDTTTQKSPAVSTQTVKTTELTAQSANIARQIYSDLTGENSKVKLTLHIQGSENGTIRVGDKVAGTYTSGQATITVTEGKVKIAIEPNEKGMQRWEESVQAGGPEMTKDIKIESMGNPGEGPGDTTVPIDHGHEYGGTLSDDNPGSGWRKAFWVSAVVTAGVGGVATFGAIQQSGAGGGPFNPNTGSNCVNSNTPRFKNGVALASVSDCENANYWAPKTTDALIGAGVVGAFAIVALYEGYLASHDSNPKEHAENHRKHRDRVVVTPVVLPQGGGATFQISW